MQVAARTAGFLPGRQVAAADQAVAAAVVRPTHSRGAPSEPVHADGADRQDQQGDVGQQRGPALASAICSVPHAAVTKLSPRQRGVLLSVGLADGHVTPALTTSESDHGARDSTSHLVRRSRHCSPPGVPLFTLGIWVPLA